MNLFKTLKFIYTHPYNSKNRINSIVKFLKWQINCIINPYPIIYPFTENSKLIVWKGLTGATGNLYCGLMEYNDMGFLLHFLRPNDLFIDVGANIGAYSILASGEIGANTIAFEPVPSTFENLKKNININSLNEKIQVFNIGLGSELGQLRFTKSFDTVNHVTYNNDNESVNVEISTLDIILSTLSAPTLVKIDVEGFESEVLKGAEIILNNENLKAIIIELNGSGKRYNFDDLEIHNNLLKLGFNAYGYYPNLKQLFPISKFGDHNTIYLRDIDFVKSRIITSRSIKIGNYFI